jgi:hypothetical protein
LQARFPGTGSQRFPKVPKNRFPRAGSQARFAGIGFQGQVSKNRFPSELTKQGFPSKASRKRFASKVFRHRCPSKVFVPDRWSIKGLSRFISNSSQAFFRQTFVDFFIQLLLLFSWGLIMQIVSIV